MGSNCRSYSYTPKQSTLEGYSSENNSNHHHPLNSYNFYCCFRLNKVNANARGHQTKARFPKAGLEIHPAQFRGAGRTKEAPSHFAVPLAERQ